MIGDSHLDGVGELVAGRYRRTRFLGAGAMATVWQAYDEALQRDVALKEVRVPPGLDAADLIARLRAEASAAARLSHPAVVTVHDVVTDGDHVLIAMEYLEGPTLADVVRRAGATPSTSARAVLTQIAEALAVAHEHGIVHRDIKPDNAFWLPSGRVVVCDFGLARSGAGSGTVVGTIMGTPGYMAPEQVRGEEVGPTADVFGWGALAYELLTAQAPFGDPSTEDHATLLYNVVHEDPTPLDLDDDELVAIVMRALAKDPLQRQTDGRELVAMLTGTIPVPPPPRTRRRRLSRAALSAMLLAVLFVAAATATAVVFAGGGMGRGIQTESLQRASAEGSARSKSDAPPTLESLVTTFHRTTGETPCLEVKAEPRPDAPTINCPVQGSLLGGDGKTADGGGVQWVHVHEPVSNKWGWVPAPRVTPA